MRILKELGRIFLLVSALLVVCFFPIIPRSYCFIDFVLDVFVADLFRICSPENRPGSPIQDDKETEDDINIVGSEEEDMTNEVGVKHLVGCQVLDLQQPPFFLLINEEVVKG